MINFILKGQIKMSEKNYVKDAAPVLIMDIFLIVVIVASIVVSNI